MWPPWCISCMPMLNPGQGPWPRPLRFITSICLHPPREYARFLPYCVSRIPIKRLWFFLLLEISSNNFFLFFFFFFLRSILQQFFLFFFFLELRQQNGRIWSCAEQQFVIFFFFCQRIKIARDIFIFYIVISSKKIFLKKLEIW